MLENELEQTKKTAGRRETRLSQCKTIIENKLNKNESTVAASALVPLLARISPLPNRGHHLNVAMQPLIATAVVVATPLSTARPPRPFVSPRLLLITPPPQPPLLHTAVLSKSPNLPSSPMMTKSSSLNGAPRCA